MLELAAVAQAVACVLAERLEHPEERHAAVGPGRDERALHETVEHVEHALGRDPAASADRAGRLGVAAGGHHGQPLEHEPLVLLEQAV